MTANRLLLIGWEAADWKILQPLMDAGDMPVLHGIVQTGTSGQLLSTQPLTSVAQWTTIATGKRSWQHRVCHPTEAITQSNVAIPVTSTQWRSLPLWQMLAQAGKRSLIVGWPATHGARVENSVIVSDRFAQPTAGPGIKPWPPAAPGTYWPEEIRNRLDGWRMSPEDVQADIISLCIPEWKKIDQKRDRRLGLLRLFLAADFSHQTAMMTLLSGGNWDFAAVHFPALGAISRTFLANYAPPLGAESPVYQNVIRGTCRLLDQMLGNLIRAAGDNTAVLVISAHGVARQAPLPGRTASEDEWKSPHGIFAACGPGLATDTPVLGASILDIAPTLLTWFGLPIGDDMEGRILLESFAKAPGITRVASWEQTQTVTPSHGNQPPTVPNNPAATARLRRESDWNLAQSYLEASRYEDALPIFERIFLSFPERPEFGHALFQCQLTPQKLSDATATLEVVLEGLPAGIWSLLPRAELCVAQGQFREARALVNAAQQMHTTHPEALRRLGLLLLRLREWNALEDLAREALNLDNNDALAWAGLAEAQLRKQRAAEATESAQQAVRLNYYLSEAHFILARSLVAQGKWAQARDAMQVLLRLQPDNRAAANYERRLR